MARGKSCCLLACVLFFTSANAQGSGSMASVLGRFQPRQQPQQLSMAESFGPITSQAINTGTQFDASPFSGNAATQQQQQTQQQPWRQQQPQQTQQPSSWRQPPQSNYQSPQSRNTPPWMQPQRQTSWNQYPQQNSWNQTPQQNSWNQTPQQNSWNQTPQQTSWNQTPQQTSWNQTPQQTSWGQRAPPKTINSPGATPMGFYNRNTNNVNSYSNQASSMNSASEKQPAPASSPMDIISQVQAFVNKGMSSGSGSTMSRPAGPGGYGQLAGTGLNPPASPYTYGAPRPPPLTPGGGAMAADSALQRKASAALLQVGRTLGKRLGVDRYYTVHGCADPTTLFTGRGKIMATFAMAQGCHSPQAKRICMQAQVKERVGNSLVTSRVLPPQVRSRLESCLSAKVIFTSLSARNTGPMNLMQRATGAPSMRECGMLLSTVMEGGALDPESMIHTRRSMLPWSCNQVLIGNAVPYRVCCPGRVMEPTIAEAGVLRNMLNANA